MKISTFFYNVGQGFKNVWRNRLFSLASIATMTACIFLFGVFYSIGTNFTNMVKTAEEGVAVTVFFDAGISQDRIDELQKEVLKRPEVSECNYISPEEAWETFKEEIFAGKEEVAAAFADDNPLANSASFEIYLNDVSMQPTLVSFLEGLDGIRQVNQSEVAAQTLTDMNNLMAIIFMGVVIILIAVSIFLISNTVTVGISVRKEEIAIMKLIGAKDSFVRAPFIVEGVFIGFIGSIIPMVLLFFLYENVVRYVGEQFTFLSGMINFVPVVDIFRSLLPIAIALGIGIGWLGSRFTLHKHLRV